MKTIVKLLSQFIDAGGGVTYRGEKIGVSAETAKRLINSGAAVAVSISPGAAKNLADVTELVERTTKPIANTPTLKGAAKLSWLRKRIREYGVGPKGCTIVVLTDQLYHLER